jgi:uncharacterized Zn finger protein
MLRKGVAMNGGPWPTEAQISELALLDGFARGREYFEHGAVTRVTLRGARLQAEVEGSQYIPYEVNVTLADGGITKAAGTCPYGESWDGACKHVVATLLACLHLADRVEEHPSLEAVPAPLDREQLPALLQALVAQQPGLADLIEDHVKSRQSLPVETSSSPRTARRRQTSAETVALRRQVHSVLRLLDRLR